MIIGDLIFNMIQELLSGTEISTKDRSLIQPSLSIRRLLFNQIIPFVGSKIQRRIKYQEFISMISVLWWSTKLFQLIVHVLHHWCNYYSIILLFQMMFICLDGEWTFLSSMATTMIFFVLLNHSYMFIPFVYHWWRLNDVFNWSMPDAVKDYSNANWHELFSSFLSHCFS